MRGSRSFLLADLVALDIPVDLQRWLFLGFMIAFAIKAPLWPFHTWLPDAAAEATPANAAYLSGVMDKVGTYGMIALVLPMFPDAAREFAPVVVVLAVISIIYGALLADRTDRHEAADRLHVDLALRLHRARHLRPDQPGCERVDVLHGQPRLLDGGAVRHRRLHRSSAGRSRLVADYGGVSTPAPLLAGSLLFAGLAGLALPGLATFIGEFLVLVGTFGRYRVAAVVATVGDHPRRGVHPAGSTSAP